MTGRHIPVYVAVVSQQQQATNQGPRNKDPTVIRSLFLLLGGFGSVWYAIYGFVLVPAYCIHIWMLWVAGSSMPLKLSILVQFKHSSAANVCFALSLTCYVTKPVQLSSMLLN